MAFSDNQKGAAFIVVSTGFISASLICAKAMQDPALMGAPGLHPLQAAWGRFAFGFLSILAFSFVRWPGIRTSRLGLHLARTLCGWSGIAALFAALALMRAADATAISFLNGLCAMVFAVLFLGEKVGPWRWGAALIAFIGAVVIARPGTDAFQWSALLAAGAAMVMGLEVILIKQLTGGSEPRPRILLINNALGALIATIAVLFVWRMPNALQWLMLVGAGVFMIGAQVFFLRGLSLAEANLAAPFNYFTLIFASLYAFILFGEVPVLTTWIGAGLIVAGGIILAWREQVKRPMVRVITPVSPDP